MQEVAEQLEAVQRRTLHIVYSYSRFTPYITTLALVGIPTLKARHLDSTKWFFRKVNQPDNYLHHFLPPCRDPAVTSHFRKPTVYPGRNLRTKRYCSTISYGLLNF